MHHPGFDIRSHTFTRSVRGVDEAEVEAALHAVAPAYEEARAILQELEQALTETLAERERLLEGERSVIKLIRSAEEHARMRIGTAHRDAARIVERAEEQARELLIGAEAQRATALSEIDAITRRRHHLVDTVAGFVEAMAAEPSTAFVPDALAIENQSTTDPAWAPLGEQEETDLAASLSWTDEGAQSATEEALESFNGVDVVPEETTAGEEVEPTPDLTTAWSVDQEGAGHGWWARVATRRVLTAAGAVAMLAAAVAIPAIRGSSGTSSRTSRTAAQPSAVLAASFVPQPATTEPVPGAATASPAPVAQAANPFADRRPVAPLSIKLTSIRSCWVGVTVDGESDSVLLEPGDELERSGSKQIRLRIGDAGAATLALNGQTLPPLGRSGEVVDRTFTAEDATR